MPPANCTHQLPTAYIMWIWITLGSDLCEKISSFLPLRFLRPPFDTYTNSKPLIFSSSSHFSPNQRRRHCSPPCPSFQTPTNHQATAPSPRPRSPPSKFLVSSHAPPRAMKPPASPSFPRKISVSRDNASFTFLIPKTRLL